jgi:hypothetical protein
MTNENLALNYSKTLAERLNEGRLPPVDALRYAMQLADSLRKLHESGKAHGTVSPANLALVAGGVELLPASEGGAGAITPYTAPEVVQGCAADARSDIFSFGAILFELMTGRRPDGESRAVLTAHLSKTPAPVSGSAAIDRLVGSCLRKDPDARPLRMRRVLMELKVVSVGVRHAGSSRMGQSVEEMRRHMSQFERNMAADLVDIEQTIKAQAGEIESLRTAMSQTDDLVERVVEALESQPPAVPDAGAGKQSSIAVN